MSCEKQPDGAWKVPFTMNFFTESEVSRRSSRRRRPLVARLAAYKRRSTDVDRRRSARRPHGTPLPFGMEPFRIIDAGAEPCIFAVDGRAVCKIVPVDVVPETHDPFVRLKLLQRTPHAGERVPHDESCTGP